METTTARMIEKNAFMLLKYSLLTARVRLPDCRRDCVPDRRFKLNKGTQPFHPHAQRTGFRRRDARQ
jgi:hypothetical protein